MDPLLDKIERIDDKYAIKILDCYCHKLKELVANKQRAHSIISSLNIKMGKHHSEKPTVRTSEMPAASPPTRILLPPPALRQIRSFRYQEAEEIMHDFGFSSQFIARKTTPQQPIETPKRKKKQEIPLTDQIIETKSKGKKMNNSKQKPSQPPNLPKTQKSNKVPTQEIKSRTFKVKITSQKKQPIKDNKIKVKINKNMEERKLPKRAKDGSKKLPRDKQTKKVSEQYIYSPNKHSLAKLNLNTTEIIFEVDRKDEETPGTSKRNQINKSPGNSKTLSKFHKISSRKSPQHSKSTFNQPKKTIKHIEDSIQQDFLENTIAKIQLNPPNSQFFELVNRKEEKVINKRDLWVENFKKNKFQSAYKKVFDTQGQENLRNCEKTFNSKIFPKYRRRPLEKMNIATAPPLLTQFSIKFDEFQKTYQSSKNKNFFPSTNADNSTCKIHNKANLNIDITIHQNIRKHSISNYESSMSETDLDELINVRLPKSEKKFFDSYLSRALSSDITSGKSPGNNLMIREFLNLLEENPTAPTHTQSEIGFIQIEPYFKGLEINNPNSSNYLDQMTTNDREYFMESQNEIYLHIQQIAQEYKKNKKLSEEKSFIRAETIGVVGHKKDLLQIYSFPSKQSSKPRK